TPQGSTATRTNTKTPTRTRTPTNTRTVTPAGTRTVAATNTRGVPSPVPTSLSSTPVPTNPTSRSSPTPCLINFTDARPSNWFYDPVRWLVCSNIASGYGDSTFRPGNSTNRAQIAKMTVLASG